MKPRIYWLYSVVFWIGFLCGRVPASPTTQQWLQSTIDSPDAKAHGVLSLTAKTPQEFNAVPTPPAPPPRTINRIVQSADKFAFDVGSGDLTLNDVVVSQGGLVRFKSKGGTLRINRCWSEGATNALGTYFVLVAASWDNRLRQNVDNNATVIWDNTGAPDRWICSGPDSGARFMGGGKELRVINVDFVCRLHAKGDNAGKKLAPIPQLHPLKQPVGIWTEWKQNPQTRHFDSVLFQGTLPNETLPDGQGRIVGIADFGAQANPLSPQFVREATMHNYGLQKFPNLTDPKSYGTVRMLQCFKIDGYGHAIRDSKGNVVMWPDQIWRGR